MGRRHARLATAGLAMILALTGCGGGDDDGGGEEPAAGEGTEAGDGEPQASGQGFENCGEEPNTCNSGERAEGGSISWIVEQPASGWLSIQTGVGTAYNVQALHGILPHTGYFLPDGVTYQFNMDLLAAEPELLSEEPFSFQFQIREEAVWNDGTPITAADFEVLWKLSASEDEGHCVGCDSRSTSTFDQIQSIEGSNNGKTVTITLKEGQRNAEWFTYGGTGGITGGIPPAHLAEEQGWDLSNPEDVGEYFTWLHETRPTYSGGPYVIVDGDLENQIIKEPNPEWYGETLPTLDTVIVRFLTEQSAWVQAVANDEVQGGNPTQLNTDIVQQLQDMPNVMVDLRSGPSWEHLDFNLDVPAFQDPALRRAIFTAVDTADIAERNWGALFPDYSLRTNHIFPETSEYHEDLLEGTGYGSGDLEAARAILEDAGYVMDGGTLTLDGEQIGPFRLRSTAVPARTISMELIQAQLAEIGIEIVIETTDDLGGMLGEQDYDIAQFGWSGTPAFLTAPAQFWSSESGGNFGKYSNPEVDELVTQVLNATSLDEAAQYANQAAEIVMEDAYVLPMYDTPVYLFVTDEYINVRDNAASSLRGLYNNHAWGLVAQ